MSSKEVKPEKIAVDVMKFFDRGKKEDNPIDELKKLDSKIGQRVDKAIDVFFNIEDEFNLSKTDIPSPVVYPLSLAIDFMINPTPTYNSYINSLTLKDFQDDGFIFENETVSEKNLEAVKESLYVSCKEIVNTFFIKTYIPALVSKDRLGRREGKAIVHGLTEMTKMINEKYFGMQPSPFMGNQIEVDK